MPPVAVCEPSTMWANATFVGGPEIPHSWGVALTGELWRFNQLADTVRFSGR